MQIIKVFLSIVYLIAFFSVESLAITWNSAYIESFAKNYLTENILPPVDGKIAFEISSIDHRVVINSCQTPLQANIPENINRRNVNIKISCADSTPWQIYLHAKVERSFAVVVATNNIEKGVVLSKNNIGIEYLAPNKIRGEKLNNLEALLGSKAERRIAKGRTITRRNVCLICKGNVVTIEAQSNNFSIKTKGIALSSGNLHQQIKVKNSQSGRVIKAEISAINRVTINL